MRNSFLFVYLLAGLFTFSGCTNPAEPDSGAINGSVFPTNSISSVYLIQGTDTLKVTPAADGSFALSKVKAGWYDLTGKPAAGFDVPKSQHIIITGGQTMQATSIKPEVFPVTGKLTVTMNEKVYTAPLDSAAQGNSDISATADGFTFQFRLPGISGLDTFNTATQKDLMLTILEKNKSWEAFDTLGSTALKITKYDAATKRADAVFTFKAGSAGEKDLVGTKGILRYFKVK